MTQRKFCNLIKIFVFLLGKLFSLLLLPSPPSTVPKIRNLFFFLLATGGEGTTKLRQVEVEIFSNVNCEKAYSNSTIGPKTFPKGIAKQQLCAGSTKGGKDACQVLQLT
mgnify:CR=1 FL=1